jgi:hypothetical protein
MKGRLTVIFFDAAITVAIALAAAAISFLTKSVETPTL